MPDQNWYEINEDMPLPLTEEEAKAEADDAALTRETTDENARLRFPGVLLPGNTNITVIPIIPGITLFGYLRFLNASPGEPRVDIYVNGRKVASDLMYRNFTEYRKVFPGWYRIAVYAAGTVQNPLTVTTLRVQPSSITTMAVIGLSGSVSTLAINDNRRFLNPNRSYVRFIQLSPNAPTMDAYWDDALVLSELEYQEVSRYLMTTPGSHNLKMRDSLSGANLVEDPNVELKAGKAYTIYVVGDVVNSRPGLQVLVPLEGASYLDFED